MSKDATRGLGPIIGHEEVRAGLARSAALGELAQTLLFHGPPGIGKQRTALWLAQLLVCSKPSDAGPCDTCTACRLTIRLEYPDVHWFFPLPRPRVSGGTDRMADALEDARALELSARRENPFRPTLTGEPVGLYVAHVQVLRRLAYAPPAVGRRKVLVIGDAEQLVPQEASPEAANALLKVLEEPPRETTFVLTTSTPDALLPTLRSRLTLIRLLPLAEEIVARFLIDVRDANPADARTAARLAQGSVGRALAFLPGPGGTTALEDVRQAARALLEAAIGGPADTHTAALSQAPSGARGATFASTLEHLALWLRDLAAAANGADDLIINADATEWIRTTIQRVPRTVFAVPTALRAVDSAAQLAQFNVNPQLTTAWLLRALRRELISAAPDLSSP